MDYNYGNKRQYRRVYLSQVKQRLLSVPLKERIVVYLETNQGLETEILLRRGYLPRNLHAVNCNPAQVATLTTRIRNTSGVRVNTHGLDITETIRRLKNRGCFPHVLHLDFCGNLSKPMIVTIRESVALLKTGSVVIINLLRGRECFERDFFLDSPIADALGYDALRRKILMSAIGNLDRNILTDLAGGSYKSTSGQPMWFTVGTVWNPTEASRRLDTQIQRLTEKQSILMSKIRLNPTPTPDLCKEARRIDIEWDVIQAASDAVGRKTEEAQDIFAYHNLTR